MRILFVIALLVSAASASAASIEPSLRYDPSTGGVWAEGLDHILLQREKYLDFYTLSPTRYNSPLVNFCLDIPAALEIPSNCGRVALVDDRQRENWMQFPENSIDPLYGESGFLGYLYEPGLGLDDLGLLYGVLDEGSESETQVPLTLFVGGVTVPEPSTLLLSLVGVILLVSRKRHTSSNQALLNIYGPQHLRQNSDCLPMRKEYADQLVHFSSFSDWYEKLVRIPEHMITDACKEASGVGIPMTEALETAHLLLKRRSKMCKLFTDNASMFPKRQMGLFTPFECDDYSIDYSI